MRLFAMSLLAASLYGQEIFSRTSVREIPFERTIRYEQPVMREKEYRWAADLGREAYGRVSPICVGMDRQNFSLSYMTWQCQQQEQSAARTAVREVMRDRLVDGLRPLLRFFGESNLEWAEEASSGMSNGRGWFELNIQPDNSPFELKIGKKKGVQFEMYLNDGIGGRFFLYNE